MITYQTNFSGGIITVLLNDKIAGTIRQAEDGYQYFPKGKKIGGEIFKTIKQTKESLEND